MTGWELLLKYILDQRKSGQIQVNEMNMESHAHLTLRTESGRSQGVLIEYCQQSNGSQWAQIGSPCGDVTRLSEASILVVLRRVDRMVVGGVVVNDNTLILRHTLSLDAVTVEVIQRSLASIVSSAGLLASALE